MTAELDACFADPGFTPPAACIPALLEALCQLDDERATRLERVLARAGAAAAVGAERAFARAPALGRERLIKLIGRVAAEDSNDAAARWLTPLLAGLTDTAPKVQRAAARALGNLGDARAETPLVSVLTAAALPEQRALVVALGKLGGPLAQHVLTTLDTGDTDLRRRVDQALVLIGRRLSRSTTSALVLDRPLPASARMALFCRRGLSDLLATELTAWRSARVMGPSRVELDHRGPFADLLVSRIAERFGLVVRMRADLPLEQRVVEALAAPPTLAALSAWTQGVPRVRLLWGFAGHQRALSWKVAELLGRRTAAVANDPRGATWSVEVARADATELWLCPELRTDPRFEYRKRDVPAASHPTLAAALARAAGVSPNDVVWDPFVGSGLELVERFRLGPAARFVGTDRDPRALAAADENLRAAAVPNVELVEADALHYAPGNVSLILTNPPMGRRVARDGSLAVLLSAFVEHAARVLVPGGRLVWLSPLDEVTARAAKAVGLRVHTGASVDMHGFEARLQHFVRQP